MLLSMENSVMKTTRFEILRVICQITLITTLLSLVLFISVSCAYHPQPEAGAVQYEPITTYATWK